MIQALKKNAIFLFYASLIFNGFRLYARLHGDIIQYLGFGTHQYFFNKLGGKNKHHNINGSLHLLYRYFLSAVFPQGQALPSDAAFFGAVFFLLRTDLRHNGAVISYRYSGGGCGDTGVCFQRNLSRKGI